MNSVLFYSGVCAFALGIFLRSFFAYGLASILCVGIVAFALLVVWSRTRDTLSSSHLFICCIVLISFCLGSLRMESATWSEVNEQFETQLGNTVALEGEVVQEPDIRTTSQHLFVAVDDELLLVTTDVYTPVEYGDIISFEGKLEKPEPFTTDLGRTFNYRGYLQARGINYVVSFADVEVVKRGKGNPVIALLLSFKHAFIKRIEAVITQPYVGLSEGLLLGVKRALGEDLEHAFRTTGIMHIVVLSGYNIMLVVLFVTYLLSLFLPLRGRLIFGLLAIVLFACMVGLSATVVRASGMAVLILIAKATGRTYAVLRALAVTAIVMLIANPYLLAYDVGFQLSFIATLGLILVAPHVEQYLGFMPTRIGLREFLTATIATQIFVTPILLYQIGEFSLVAVIVNVLVLPMVPVAMLLTFITGMVGFISTSLSVPFGFLSYLSLSYIVFIAETFAQLPFASIIVPPFPFYVVILSYMFLAYLLWHLQTKKTNVLDPLSLWTVVEESLFMQEVTAKVKDPTVPTFFR